MKECDLKAEIEYWKKQCDSLKKDIRFLTREVWFLKSIKDDKYEKFKEWVITYHSDVWVVKGVFDGFEETYGKFGDNDFEMKNNKSKKLLLMQDFLKTIGLKSNLHCDGKLYLMDIEDKEEEILSKCDELSIVFVQEQNPVYGPMDPHTLKRDIHGFVRRYYFEERVEDE